MSTRFTHGALLAAVALVTSAAALAQPPGGFGGGRRFGPPPGVDPAALTARLAANFEQLAAYDANRDGALDEGEQANVATAVANGTLGPQALRPPFPPRGEAGPPRGGDGPPPGDERGPPGGRPDPAMLPMRVARMYERLATFDADKNGVLDAAEQAALSNDLPALGPGPGGRGPGGPGPGGFQPEAIHDAGQPAGRWPTRI